VSLPELRAVGHGESPRGRVPPVRDETLPSRVRRHGPPADTASSTPPGTARHRPKHGKYSPDPTPNPCRSSSDTPHGPDSRPPSPRPHQDRTSRSGRWMRSAGSSGNPAW
jgi:hypothetical protein